MPNDQSKDAQVFDVETRFQKLARRPGGVPRELALERAQADLDKSLPAFDAWLSEELDRLVALSREAAAAAFPDIGWAQDAAVQSGKIRDVGTTMGYDLITFIANNLCEIFEAISAGGDYRPDLIDCHLEALLLVRQERYRGMRPDQVPELISGLRLVVERATASVSIVPE
jgi:hypothetical protein